MKNQIFLCSGDCSNTPQRGFWGDFSEGKGSSAPPLPFSYFALSFLLLMKSLSKLWREATFAPALRACDGYISRHWIASMWCAFHRVMAVVAGRPIHSKGPHRRAAWHVPFQSSPCCPSLISFLTPKQLWEPINPLIALWIYCQLNLCSLWPSHHPGAICGYQLHANNEAYSSSSYTGRLGVKKKRIGGYLAWRFYF